MRVADHDLLPTLSEVGADDITVVALSVIRSVAAGYATGDVGRWDAAYDAAERLFEASDAQQLVAAMTGVIRAIRTECSGGWSFMPATCCRVTPHEHEFIAALNLARIGRPREMALLAAGARGSRPLVSALRAAAKVVNRLAGLLSLSGGQNVALHAAGSVALH